MAVFNVSRDEKYYIKRLVYASVLLVIIIVFLSWIETRAADCQTNYVASFYMNLLPTFVASPNTSDNLFDFVNFLQHAVTAERQEIITTHIGVDSADVRFLDTAARDLAQLGIALRVRESIQLGTEIRVMRYADKSLCSQPLFMTDEELVMPRVAPETMMAATANDFVRWNNGAQYFITYNTITTINVNGPKLNWTQFSDITTWFPGLRLLPVRPREPLLNVRNTTYRQTYISNITIVHRPTLRSDARLNVLRDKASGKLIYGEMRLRTIPILFQLKYSNKRIPIVSPAASQATEQFFNRLMSECVTGVCDQTTLRTERNWALS